MNNIRLNRIVIADVPDIFNFKYFEGRCAYDIFSSGAIIGTVRENAEALGIDLSVTDNSDLPKCLSAALESGSDCAQAIAADFGRRLGLIAATMKMASEKTRCANERYEDEDWQPWTELNKIFLSGGLANGTLGRTLSYYGNDLLRTVGIQNMTLELSRCLSYDQLIGCARRNTGDASCAVVFDFGHSFVKSAVASFTTSSEEKSLVRLGKVRKIPGRYMGRDYGNSEIEYSEAVLLHEFIADTVKERFSELSASKQSLSSHIVISIANNVTEGRIGYGGCYYKLMRVSPEYETYLSDCLSELLGRKINATLIHDGQAAALSVAGEKNSVLIALGTAFGVGFPPENTADLRTMEGFAVSL